MKIPGADANSASDGYDDDVIFGVYHIHCILHLLCFGAEIDENAIDLDVSGLLVPINDRLRLLRNGNRIGTSLMGNEERRFMWNLAFCFTIAHREAAFKGYYAIRSFITFHGIFMAPGYNSGKTSIWQGTGEVESILLDC